MVFPVSVPVIMAERTMCMPGATYDYPSNSPGQGTVGNKPEDAFRPVRARHWQDGPACGQLAPASVFCFISFKRCSTAQGAPAVDGRILSPLSDARMNSSGIAPCSRWRPSLLIPELLIITHMKIEIPYNDNGINMPSGQLPADYIDDM